MKLAVLCLHSALARMIQAESRHDLVLRETDFIKCWRVTIGGILGSDPPGILG
jgi:hypothetical protein